MATKTWADPSDLAKKHAHISVQRYFEISLLLMLGTSFVTVATTGKLDLPSILLIFFALLLKLWSYVREADYSLSPRTVSRIAIFYIFFYGLDFLIFSADAGPTLLDHMLAATVHLVLFATVIKVFSARTYRDYGYLVTLSFMMMLSSAILTVGTTYLACFGFYVLFSISTFISYEIKRAAESAARPAQGPFSSPAQNRTAIEKALFYATVGLALGIVALSSVLFFVIPRYRTGYLTALGADRQNITGFSESVNLGDMRSILQSSSVVMRIVPTSDPKRFQGIKWRGVALTSFDGTHWFNDNTAQTILRPVSTAPGFMAHFLVPNPPAWRSRVRHPLQYRVLLSALTTDVIFAAYFPSELSGRLRYITYDETQSLRNPRHGYAPFGYDMISDTTPLSPAELRAASSTLPQDIRLIYLQLPDKIDPRIAVLAKKAAGGTTNNYDRAIAVQTFLRKNFTYSLNPPSIEPKDPVGSFLFNSKTGYCEYFAAAMALMVRTLGIPSRMVNGFQTGSFNQLGGDFVVRARDAHSWVEIYFPQYGWVPFDPTPADPHAVAGGGWGALDDYIDAINLFWGEWVIDYDFGHQVELARSAEQQSRQLQQAFQRRVRYLEFNSIRMAYIMEGWLMTHKVLVFIFMVAILAALILEGKNISVAELRFLWAWKFHRGELALGPREAALTYQRFLSILRKRGYKKSPSQTPREFALSFVGSQLSAGVDEFTCLYNAFRYGRAMVSLSRLRELLDDLGKK
jgi:protein-glutamine gamma-glutamyltransferase